MGVAPAGIEGLNSPSALVTGASSGIGRATALLLARSGFRVFAGVRRAEDGESLRNEAPSLVAVSIDVTSPGSIRAAAERVAGEVGDAGLAGLVNNAGVGIAAPVETLPLDDLRRLFEVNVFGQVAVTQAFLPLVRRARGRIVNIGSIGDRLSIPFGGALCASKAAVAALNDSLRMELADSGVRVCLVEPASIATAAVDKLEEECERSIAALSPEGARLYADPLRRFLRRAGENERKGSPPEVVARAVLEALTSPSPRTRRLVGADSTLLATLARWVPDPLLDRIRRRVFGLS